VEKASRIHLILNFGHMKNNVKIIHWELFITFLPVLNIRWLVY
jgi:hypothetical protein